MDWENNCKMLEQKLNQEIEKRNKVEKTLQCFGVMTEESKNILLMPLCFHQNAGKMASSNLIENRVVRTECMYETFGSLVR